MRYLADYATGRDNNFNLIRFLAASAVVFSHSYPISGYVQLEPVAKLLSGFMDLATIAVVVFFALSGFLIAQSWDRLGTFGSFVKARTARLVPGLIATTLFAAMVVGPLATSHSLSGYFRDEGFLKYLFDNMQFGGVSLPGVFASNPIPWAINGSLWTVAVEAWCYAALMLMGAMGAIRRPWLAAMVVLAAICCYAFWPQWVREYIPQGASYMTPSLVGVFLIGAMFYVFRRRVPVSRVIVLIALGGLYAAWGTRYTLYLFYVVFAYCVLVMAYHPAFDVPAFRKLGDYSYGIYIFAFPIQQLVIAKAGLLGPLQLFAYSYPLTLSLAGLSWHLIEHPALRWKEKGARPRSPPRDSGDSLQHPAKELAPFLAVPQSPPEPPMAASDSAPQAAPLPQLHAAPPDNNRR